MSTLTSSNRVPGPRRRRKSLISKDAFPAAGAARNGTAIAPFSLRLGKGEIFGLVESASGDVREAEGTAMVEFLQNYSLWIVLAGVFVAMHRFGMGCCGGGHHQRPTESTQGNPREKSDESTKSMNGQKSPKLAKNPSQSCH